MAFGRYNRVIGLLFERFCPQAKRQYPFVPRELQVQQGLQYRPAHYPRTPTRKASDLRTAGKREAPQRCQEKQPCPTSRSFDPNPSPAIPSSSHPCR